MCLGVTTGYATCSWIADGALFTKSYTDGITIIEESPDILSLEFKFGVFETPKVMEMFRIGIAIMLQ